MLMIQIEAFNRLVRLRNVTPQLSIAIQVQ